jgi:ribonuclease P protein component
VATKSLLMYRSASVSGDASSLVGITVSKSIGKAVIRNKVRRRLAAVLDQALEAQPAMRLLVVARPAAAEAAYSALQAEVASALAGA